MKASSEITWQCIVKQDGSVALSAIESVFECILGSVLESVLRSVLESGFRADLEVCNKMYLTVLLNTV